MFCYVQPLLFCAVYVINQNQEPTKTTSLYTLHVMFNASSQNFSQYDTNIAQNLPAVSNVEIIKIDVIFFLIPFAFAVSITSMAWVKLIENDLLQEGTQWDTNLESDVMMYELAYYFEIFTCNAAFISVVCNFKSAIALQMFCLLLTIVMCMFCAQARFKRDSPGDNLQMSLLILILIVILFPYCTVLLNVQCSSVFVVSFVHICIIFLICNYSFIANGNLNATQILAFRIPVTVLSCIVLLVTYFLGMDQRCHY